MCLASIFDVLLLEIILQLNCRPIAVLHPKQITKPCHEDHVHVIMHVTECVDQFLIT